MNRSAPSVPDDERDPIESQDHSDLVEGSGQALVGTPEDSRDSPVLVEDCTQRKSDLTPDFTADDMALLAEMQQPEGEEFQEGRAYFRFPQLGQATASIKIREHTGLSVSGTGFGLPFVLVGFGPVAIVLVGGLYSLPAWAIMVLSLTVVVALAGLMILVLILLGKSEKN